MPPRTINVPALSFFILFATLVIAGIGGMSVVSLRQKIAESSQRLQKSETETTRLERLNEELRAKIALMEHPEALKRIAQKFGMQPAKLDQYRLVKDTSTPRSSNPNSRYATAAMNDSRQIRAAKKVNSGF